MKRFVFLLALVLVSQLYAADAVVRREWVIDGVKREALVHLPESAKTTPSPVVFAFHGHGGSMQNAARQFRVHELWPEAIAVYMQGLNTPGRLTDPEGKKPGWQHAAGDQGDRDLKFFDAVLASLGSEMKVDAKSVFSTGHSNGGGFTYLLWAVRGEKLAAVAPSAAAASTQIDQLKPKPAMHIAGESDPLVKYEWQQRTMDRIRQINQCGEGTPWDKLCTFYPSKSGTPFVTFIHPGGHQFVPEAPALIVRFFREYSKK